MIATAVGVGSFAAGLAVGFKLAERRLVVQFEERLEKETASMRVFYRQVKNPYSTPEEAVADLIAPKVAAEVLTEYQGGDNKVAYHKITKAEIKPIIDPEEEEALKAEFGEEVEINQHNVFEEKHDPTVPYLISEEEYMQNDSGYQQVSLTYYELDRKVTDERDDLIENVESTIGLDFELNFGRNATDPNMAYVRNERLSLDFEIAKDERSYAKQVLDEEPNLEAPERIGARIRREREGS